MGPVLIRCIASFLTLQRLANEVEWGRHARKKMATIIVELTRERGEESFHGKLRQDHL